jgi:hypothetical protein
MQYASPAMARKPILRWAIYIFRSKLQWLGEVEAVSAEEAVTKGGEAFGQNAKRLMAVSC